MNVEAKCLVFRRTKGEKVLKSHVVSPGNYKKIDFLGKVGVTVYCSLERKMGGVSIKDLNGKVKVYRYRNRNEPTGVEMNPDSFIEIAGEQQLSIVLNKRKPEKEILIFLAPEDTDKKESPKIFFTKGLFEPPIIAA